MKEYKPWKTEADVERLTFKKTSKNCIGSGAFGDVYLGRVKFKGEKSKRVAVKVFLALGHGNMWRRHYEAVIQKLHGEGAPIPKTSFVEHEGQHVQVMELFGAKEKGSKIKNVFLSKHTEQNRTELINAICSIVNAGYYPPSDAIGFRSTKYGPKAIIHDLDNLALQHTVGEFSRFSQSSSSSPEYIAGAVYVWAKLLAHHWGVKRTVALDEMKRGIRLRKIVKAIEELEEKLQ